MNAIRTYASRPYIVFDRDTLSVIGCSGSKAHACAIGASALGENGYRVVDLSDVDGFCAAAANAGDLVGAYVAALADGRTVAEIADYYRDRIDPRSIYSDHARKITAKDARHVVAESIRECIGSLSRRAARRQVAEWILASV